MAEQTDVDSIEFKPAKGGLVSTTRKRVSMGKRENGMMGSDYKHETAIHTSLASAAKHLRAEAGHHFSKADREHEAVGMHKEASRKHESAGMKKRERSMKK